MKPLKLYLILLASLFAAPLAFADEIGSGSPDHTTTTAAAPAPAEPEESAEASCDWTCWYEEFLSWFK